MIEVCRSEGPDEPLRRPHIVVLQERNGTRRVPIYTGSAEAIGLACSLDAVEMPRPMTYQLAANLLAAGGSRLTEVRITRLVEGVFYAVVVIEAPAGVVEVDARPSDALNLALVAGAPVRVDAAVLSNPEVDCHTNGSSTRRDGGIWPPKNVSAGPIPSPALPGSANIRRSVNPDAASGALAARGSRIKDASGRCARPRQHLDARRLFVRDHGHIFPGDALTSDR